MSRSNPTLDRLPTWAEQQAERDRAAEAKAHAPTRDERTGELIPHCTGLHHRWYFVRSNVQKCTKCGAVRMR